MTIYQRIQELAKQRSVSIRQIEIDLGFSNGSMRKWKDNAPTARLNKVANYLGTTVDYLLGTGSTDSKHQKIRVDLKTSIDDDDVIMTYDGRPIPKQDLELIKRLMRGE